MEIRESMYRWVGWVEDWMGIWMEREKEMESRRRWRALTLVLLPPGKVEQTLADSPWSLRHWPQFHGNEAGQQSTKRSIKIK